MIMRLKYEQMEDRVRKIYTMLYALNFLIISTISITICLTLYRICDDYNARDFLEMARYLPHVAWKVPTYSIVLYLFIGLSDYLKGKKIHRQSTLIIILYIIDLLVYGLITYTLNFSYKGFYLFLSAGLFLYIKEMPGKILILTLALGCYIFTDYDLLTVQANMLSFQDYINYYPATAQLYFYVARSLLESLNLILVMVFFYMFINSKIRENKEFVRLNNKLKENLNKLNIANEKLEEAGRMKERNRLAHEIHDILGHSLTCISTGLEACIEIASGERTLNRQLSRIKKVSDKGLLDIRRSVKQLKSDVIAETTLIKSLKELVADINALGQQQLTMTISGKVPSLQHDEELTIFRLIQESTTNSIRHGKASRIRINMSFEETGLTASIEDDGTGTNTIKKNFGLSHIEEQLEILGGDVSFSSKEGRGFRTVASIPLRRETLK